MILCAGSVALDTTHAPSGTAVRVLGGAASFFSLSARFFSPVAVVSAIGDDFPQSYLDELARPGIDISGVQKVRGAKSFFFESTFTEDFNSRIANKTELNVLQDFKPVVPANFQNAEYVYLATLPPKEQASVISQVPKNSLCALDTISFYIEHDRKELQKAIGLVDLLVLNDSEARQLCGTGNLIKAGRKMLEMGPKAVVIKKGEHGALLFHGGQVRPFPAFPKEEIVDPTGAGDSFAGGLVGWLASRQITRKNLSMVGLCSAMAAATVLGSFAVESFSVKRLLEISRKDVLGRMNEYRRMVSIDEFGAT